MKDLLRPSLKGGKEGQVLSPFPTIVTNYREGGRKVPSTPPLVGGRKQRRVLPLLEWAGGAVEEGGGRFSIIPSIFDSSGFGMSFHPSSLRGEISPRNGLFNQMEER